MGGLMFKSTLAFAVAAQRPCVLAPLASSAKSGRPAILAGPAQTRSGRLRDGVWTGFFVNLLHRPSHNPQLHLHLRTFTPALDFFLRTHDARPLCPTALCLLTSAY